MFGFDQLELLYTFVIVACSLMIYFGTKEIYELSSHKGIRYFRQAFLFFGLAYFARFIVKFFLVFGDPRDFLTITGLLLAIAAFGAFSYLSTMAIFYLLYSIMWKKLDNGKSKIYLFHVLAVLIAIVSIFSRERLLHLGINIALLAFIAFIFYKSYKDSKNKPKELRHSHPITYATYMLLFFFWILNILDTLVPNFLSSYKLVIYLASISIFFVILYKVLKKSGK
jgi:hypothetical protein